MVVIIRAQQLLVLTISKNYDGYLEILMWAFYSRATFKVLEKIYESKQVKEFFYYMECKDEE